MNEDNGNGANGNGHQKVFQLARVETPEELQAKAARRIAPEIRTSVSFTRLPMAAKGFFSALLDLSFLHCYGGNGRGKIFITVRDLSRLLKHDKDSIAEWRRILINAKVLWYREDWPRSEWRICALCPAPNTDFEYSEEHFIVGKAAALEAVRSLPPATFSAPNSDSPNETEETRQTRPSDSPTYAETFGQTDRNLPLRGGNPSATSDRNLPSHGGKPSASRGESASNNEGKCRSVCRKPSAPIRSLLRRKGVLEQRSVCRRQPHTHRF